MARRLVAAEFFSGIGLVRLALESEGWRVKFANDIDPDKAEIYEANFSCEPSHLLVGDIHKLIAEELPKCDLFTASFPCNDLSIAGKWEGLNGKESSAFWGLIRLLRELGTAAPEAILLENVVGFLLRNDGADLATALSALNELGYSVDAVILNAKHWTPQSRARLFVIGKRSRVLGGESLATVEQARPKSLVRFINSHPEIDWDICELPSLPPAKHRLTDIVEDLPPSDPLWWNEERVDYFIS
jgi:DNA (cytosine-5)-methyltransferase 1